MSQRRKKEKHPPAFIVQRAEGSELFLFFCVLVEGGWEGEKRGSCVGGGSGLGLGVRSKCVIVTKLTRKSRGGQCADRTLGCMIHRGGLNGNSAEPPSSHLCCQSSLWNQ